MLMSLILVYSLWEGSGPLEAGEIAERGARSTREPQSGRLRPLAKSLRVDPVRIAEELAHHQASAGLEHARELGQRRLLVRDFSEHGHQQRGVEGRVPVGEPTRVALGGCQVVDGALG